MTVTRKTYRAVADAVREAWADVYLDVDPSEDALQYHRALVDRLASHPNFGGANPRFDTAAFVSASDGPLKVRVLQSLRKS